MKQLFENWRRFLNEARLDMNLIQQHLPDEISDNIDWEIGRGLFGVVYEYGDGHVIKFEVMSGPLTKERRDKLQKYLNFLGHFKETNYPNVARIVDYGVEGIDYGDSKVVLIYIVMEELHKLESTEPEAYTVLGSYAFRSMGRASPKNAAMLITDINSVLSHDKQSLNNLIDDMYDRDHDAAKRFHDLLKVPTEGQLIKLRDFALFFLKLENKKMLHHDLHRNNIMVDDEHNLVIIDHGGFLPGFGLSEVGV